VIVNGDNAIEPNETFQLILTPAGSTPIFSLATIVNDDGTALANTPWPMYGMNAQHTGDSPYVGPQTGTVAFNVEGSIIGPAGLIGGSLVNFDGSLQSSYPSGGYFPAVAGDGTIYTASEGGTLFAANPNVPGAYVNDNMQLIGGTKWTIMLGRSQYAPTIGPDGTIYVSGLDRFLYAVNANGTLKWKFQAAQEFESFPTLSPDALTVYAGSDDNNLYAVNTATGTLRWKYKATDDVNAAHAVDAAGNVYFTTSNWYGWSVKPTGKLNWKVPIRQGHSAEWAFNYSDPAIDQSNQTAYFGGFDGMYAYSFAGQLRWKYTTGSRVDAHPAIGADGLVYFTAANGTLYAVRSNGTLQWSSPNSGGIPFLGSDGTLYCGGKAFKDGGAYRPTIRWLQDTPDPVVPGRALTLRAREFSDNGVIASIDYYRDANGNNQLDVGVDDLVGTKTNGSNSWGLVVTAPATPGTYTYFAQAIDNNGNLSNVVSKTNTVANPPTAAPLIGSFSANASSVSAGSTVTLTAYDVQAVSAGSTITQVAFYRDNGDNIFDPATDTLLGYGAETAPGTWTFSFTFSTAGAYNLFAQARDSYGILSDPLEFDLDVLP
jgi:outer membrane protein assembly factor BamB